MEGKEYLSAYVDNLGKGGGESKVSRDFFQGIDSGGTDFWGRDVGYDPLYGLEPGGVSTQGRSTDHWEAAPAVIVRGLGVSTTGYSNTGEGV